MAKKPGTDMMADLRGVYERIDAMMAPFSCPSSSGCCRFGQTGREPYLTRLEEEGLRRARAARPAKKLPLLARERRNCAFLQADGRCAMYEARPFGCRTFFCTQREGPRAFPRREVNQLAQELLERSLAHFPEQRELRPIGRLFAAR